MHYYCILLVTHVPNFLTYFFFFWIEIRCYTYEPLRIIIVLVKQVFQHFILRFSLHFIMFDLEELLVLLC